MSLLLLETKVHYLSINYDFGCLIFLLYFLNVGVGEVE